MAPRPYGDHTGYYNEVDEFPVFTITHITAAMPSITAPTPAVRPMSLRCSGWRSTRCSCRCCRSSSPRSWTSTCRREGCSYRMAVVTIKKRYPGHAKRVMLGSGPSCASSCTQVRDRLRRRHQRPGLEGRDLGYYHPDGPGAGHHP